MRTFHNAKDVSGPYLALRGFFVPRRPIAWTKCEGFVYKTDTSVSIRRRVRRLEK